MTASCTVFFKIRRCAHPDKSSYWEDFQISFSEGLTIAQALGEIARYPINSRGDKTTPVVWERHCRPGPCGSCLMLINGEAKAACQYVISNAGETLTLEPLQKFPVLKDLMVDRSRLSVVRAKTRSWLSVDGIHHAGIGARIATADVPLAQKLGACTSCGACLEVCPQVTQTGGFMGAALAAQVHLTHLHPTGLMDKKERMLTILEKNGLEDCRLSGNCERACPENIPLVDTLARLNREATKSLFGFFD